MSHERKQFIRCCEPNCLAEQYSSGRCIAHYRAMDPALRARLRRMTKAERQAEFDQTRVHPIGPKWQFEPTAAQVEELILKHGGQDNES
jgi:hypothetical protein